MNDLINEPDANRLIFGLRDTGYNVRTAAADIVDNSIAAHASEVSVQVDLHEDGRKTVYFADNGEGMSAEEVHNAMRYGAPQRQSAESLGKFGLGLKTASSSVCLRFTVISRRAESQCMNKLTWDLEHVGRQNVWEMLREDVTRREREVFEELCGEHGTLVIWEKCDRILSKDYKPGGAPEKQAVKRLCGKLAQHFSLVFHRFIDQADTRERNVDIFVNGEAVEPWNPFYPSKAEQVLPEHQQVLTVELPDGSEENAQLRAWILPHSREMTKEENSKHARISNRSQGFYVYREGRLIQDGGWLEVFGAPEPHSSLLRIEFDFGHELDDAFRVDVKKSRILFHPELEEGLRKLLQPIYREAQNRYRRKNRQDLLSGGGVNHSTANKNIAETANTSKPSVSEVDATAQTASVVNNQGPSIRLKAPIQNNVRPEAVYVDAVEDITSGDLWVPAFRSPGDSGHVPAVLLNKHHDFYQKIYQRAASNGYAIEGMDLLLWAFSVAEQNNTSEDLQVIFEDIRSEISNNLKKLLRNVPDPDPSELEAADGD